MEGSSIFEQCSLTYVGEVNNILRCVSDRMEARKTFDDSSLRQWLLVVFGGFIFFMQVGFAMLCAGSVRKKNVTNTMLKNLLDACGAAVAFYAMGYALAFGGQDENSDVTFVGWKNFFLMGEDVNYAYWFFQYTFSATAVTIVAGTLAERSQMLAYLLYSLVLTGFVYPVIVHSIWSNNGFLSTFTNDPYRGVGVIDFAGSGIVHLTGGTVALIATYILGPRAGRFYDEDGNTYDSPKTITGHSVAFQLMGTFILWFGWFGFNPGSALLLPANIHAGRVAARAAVNTSLSAAAGALSALFTNIYLEERRTGEYTYSIGKTMNGALSGLVAITASSGIVYPWVPLVVGLVAGWIYLGASALLIRLRLDDAVDAIPVHMFSGLWGLLSVGLFAAPGPMLMAYGSDEHVGWFYSLGSGGSDFTLLGNQIIGICFIVGWSVGTMFPFFAWLNFMGWFRTNSMEELVGLDVAYHGSELDEEIKKEVIKDAAANKKGAKKNGKGKEVQMESSPDVTEMKSKRKSRNGVNNSSASRGNVLSLESEVSTTTV